MISVKNLSFTYPGAAKQTLHGLNFEIADGEIFGFLGPSGAGKSTTLNILIGPSQKLWRTNRGSWKRNFGMGARLLQPDRRVV